MEQISKAINKVMEKVNGIAKNMTVGSGSNSYKGVADKDVKQAIREAMIENGLSILPIGGTPKIQIDRWEQEEFYQGKSQGIKTKQSVFTDIETRYLLLHTSGESIEVYGYGQGVDTQDKGAGKATTYALKNTLLNMFLIPTGVDTDDTHSDDLDVPKKKNFGNKKWYNEVEKNIDKWKDSVKNGKITPQAIIDKIESEGYSINNANKDRILNLK